MDPFLSGVISVGVFYYPKWHSSVHFKPYIGVISQKSYPKWRIHQNPIHTRGMRSMQIRRGANTEQVLILSVA